MSEQLLVTTSHGFRAVGHLDPKAKWSVSKLTGWFERGGVRQDRSPRPWGDGNFAAPTFREAKFPAIEGLLFSTSAYDQHRAMEALEASLGNGTLTRLTVQGAAGTTWADAQLDSEPTLRPEVYGRVLAFRAQMYVPDGYRYGKVRTSASGEFASHRGTAEATPSFVVTGVLPGGYQIVSPYGTFTVLQSLGAGQTHRISFAEGGVVYRNGVAQRGVYGHPRNIWRIPPGTPAGEHALVPIGGGAGSLTVQVPDTF